MSAPPRTLVLVALLAPAVLAAPPPGTRPAPLLAELLERPFLYGVVRHLYRWYLDERDIEQLAGDRSVVLRVRILQPQLDPGDRSLFGEVSLPQLGVRVRVKRADYTIPELDVTVRSAGFKIVAVARAAPDESPLPGSTEVRFEFAELRDELFRTRRDVRFPEGELLERLRRATRRVLVKSGAAPGPEPARGPQVVHLAPLSPVANETWVFWESGRKLIRFASDIDLANAAVWAHEELAVRVYDVDEHVVVSFDEVAGSNAFLTRAQVGRALFNCIVLGRRLELEPLPAEPAERPATAPAPRE